MGLDILGIHIMGIDILGIHIMGIDILGIHIMGIDILGVDIPAPTLDGIFPSVFRYTSTLAKVKGGTEVDRSEG